MEKILTISIAAYNVEKFLQQTLDSLINEELMEKIEVLIINDGSKDNTIKIATSYVEKYPNTFILIDKKNGGHGSTINVGIANAQGKYFCLLDGDDWVDTEQFYAYIKELINIEADLIVNNFNLVNDKTKKIKNCTFKNVEYGKLYTFKSLPETEVMGLSAITYRTEILKKNKIYIDEKCFYVDMEYISYPISYIKNIVFLPYIVYQYRVNQEAQSVSRKSLLLHKNDHTKVVHELLKFYGEYQNKNNFDIFKLKYLKKVISDMILNQYSVLLLQNTTKINKEKLDIFDCYVNQKAPDIYIELNKKKWVKLLRKKSFLYYYLLNKLIKLKIR